MDLAIRGGTVVTDESVSVLDIGIEGERIVQIGEGLRGRREINADGLYVFPGGVDVHVHLSPSIRPLSPDDLRTDDFYTGSRAALAGGITTIGNMTAQWAGETLRDAVERDQTAATAGSAADYLLHPVVRDPTTGTVAEVARLAADGYPSLKIFLVLPEFDAQIDAFVEVFAAAATAGQLVMAHCEDGGVVRWLGRDLVGRGHGAVRFYPESRPDYSESVAVERAVAIARATKADLYVVHLSSLVALEACRRARSHGQAVFIETRPLYLYLTRERFEGSDPARYVGNPPLRDAADVDALWAALGAGEIECVCSDHAPWTLAQKRDPTKDVTSVRPGVADLETLMPMLFSEGVRRGRLSLQRFASVTSTNAARLFGLYPRKGAIAVGSDADLAIWDPQALRTIDGSQTLSRAGYSPYDGWEVHGWPVYTISRGEVVVSRGVLQDVRPGRGRWLRAYRKPNELSTP